MTPPLRPYRLADVAARQRKILESGDLRDLLGEPLQGDTFRRFVDGLRACLPKKIPRELIEQSVQHLVGQVLTEERLEEEAWRLGGNTRRLKNLQPVPPWGGQPTLEWVPVQIVGGEHYRTRWTNLAGMIYQFQVLAGTPCPHVMTKFWSRGVCRLAASRLGFSKPWGPRPFKDFLQMFNLRLYVLVDAEQSRDGKPGFTVIAEEQPSGVLTWNRRLLRMRQRDPAVGFVCPRRFPDSFPCYRCPMGLDECPAATHPETFVPGECPRCGSEQAWFRDARDAHCVDCEIRERWRVRSRKEGSL